jgi:hypothetical protein
MHGERNQPGLKMRVKRARRTAGDSGPSPIGNGTLELPAMAALDAAFDEYRRVDAATVQRDDCRSSHYDTAGNKSVHALRGMIADISAQLAGLERQRQTLTSLLREI